MSARQLRLFDPPKLLDSRLGTEFFRSLPRQPGIYRMLDQQERILYVGQSGNLRNRLNSYRYVYPDRNSPKLVRLIHATERIVWETCASAEAARLRENELLRLHRPRFNSLNSYPKSYWYLGLRWSAVGIVLCALNKPEKEMEIHGAFKGWGLSGYRALLCALWILAHRVNNPAGFPPGLLTGRPPRQFALIGRSGTAGANFARLITCVSEFLSGTSAQLIECLLHEAPPPASLFHKLWQEDLVLQLRDFYRAGPERNRSLRDRFGIQRSFVAQDELDDLLAAGA